MRRRKKWKRLTIITWEHIAIAVGMWILLMIILEAATWE